MITFFINSEGGDYVLTSIVILTFNKLEYTQECIESIREFTEPGSYEIIVVDNYSQDGSVEWLRQQSDIHLIANDYNAGFPAGCNQGIEAAKGDNILLLNNDTIVTKYWLTNMLQALYSSPEIGAVGPITNNSSYYQAIPIDYNTLDGMHEFAASHNIADPTKWERRVKLIGFCMLIKREVIDTIGLLDERFTPGNYEDDDYSFRMLKAGYKIIVCHDTFIHHYGGVSFREDSSTYNELYHINQKKFVDKWGFDPNYSCFIRDEIINLMDPPFDKAINVLEVGCATGATLLKIKHNYPQANLYGIELSEGSASIASTFADVRASNIENELDYPDEHFDYIIFADVLEHLYDPWTVLKKMRKYIKEDGQILISIPNVMHYSLLRDLLNGRWTYTDAGLLDRTHIRFFTLHELTKMLDEAEYTDHVIASTVLTHSEADLQWIDALTTLSQPELKRQFMAYQYVVKAYKNLREDNQVNHYIRLIDQGVHIEGNVRKLIEVLAGNENHFEKVKETITLHCEHKEKVLNIIASYMYKEEEYDYIIPILQFALEINDRYTDTLYNLGMILYKIGENDLAVSYLEKIEIKDQDILTLIEQIKNS